jgi:hypothetical protein
LFCVESINTRSQQSCLVPTRTSKRARRKNNGQSAQTNVTEMSLDVQEWLEGERIEHERRMLELGFPPNSTEKQPKLREK